MLLRGEAGVSRLGTLAQQVTVPAECLERIPEGWTDQQAACAALVYVYGKESQARGWQTKCVGVRVRHDLIGSLGGCIEADGMVGAVGG